MKTYSAPASPIGEQLISYRPTRVKHGVKLIDMMSLIERPNDPFSGTTAT